MFDWLFVFECIIIIKINVPSYSNEINWLYVFIKFLRYIILKVPVPTCIE